jgi:hypothetical protein
LGTHSVKIQNPLAYHYYQWGVHPKITHTIDYLKSNYKELIE